MKKRIFSLLLLLAMLTVLSVPAGAASSEQQESALSLYETGGLFQGTGYDAAGQPIFDLDRAPTRFEAVTMLVRLLGKEMQAKSGAWQTPFQDLTAWAAPYVGYAYENGLTSGVSETAFGGKGTVTCTQYLTFVLRALGYESGADFSWDAAWELSDKIGLTDGRYSAETKAFTRGDAALVSYRALYLVPKGESVTLGEIILGVKLPESSARFTDAVQAASAAHKKELLSTESFSGLRDYCVDDTTLAPITEEELSLFKEARNGRAWITADEGRADTEYLFHILKSAYGAYYFFGDTAFEQAKANVLAWLSTGTMFRQEDFGEQLAQAFWFVRDGHFAIWRHANETALRYEYFYCRNQNFRQDNTGYYRQINGEKYYFASFSDERVSLSRSLTADGELVYAPILFCPVGEMTPCTVTLQAASGKALTQTISWTLSEAYLPRSSQTPDMRVLSENGIMYISVRSFDASDGDHALYVNSAAAARKAKLVIYDLRSNNGGSDQYAKAWTQGFTGKKPDLKEFFAARVSALSKLHGNAPDSAADGTFDIHQSSGAWLSNNVPVIVLMDDKCGSAGESALLYARTMDNVIVIGSNSGGCMLCGNQLGSRLPNSGVPISFGVSFQSTSSAENLDYKGIEPDVWCDPKTALSSVLAMLERYGVTDADTVSALRAGLSPIFAQEAS